MYHAGNSIDDDGALQYPISSNADEVGDSMILSLIIERDMI